MFPRDPVELREGRRLLVALEPGDDLVTALAQLCRRHGLDLVSFRAAGTLAAVTVGAYDSKQQVFVTHRVRGDLDIAACEGTVARSGGERCVDARIVVSDLEGTLTGGRLFSETEIRHVHVLLQTYTGAVPGCRRDAASGLPVWQPSKP